MVCARRAEEPYPEQQRPPKTRLVGWRSDPTSLVKDRDLGADLQPAALQLGYSPLAWVAFSSAAIRSATCAFKRARVEVCFAIAVS